MKHKAAPKASNSLKTFYLYVGLVIFAITISLVIKLFIIFLQSKFDGNHHFTLVITKQQKVTEIVAFSPQIPALEVLHINDQNIAYSSLGSEYGISPDAQLELGNSVDLNKDVGVTLWSAITHYPAIKTDTTLIDLLRLTYLSKGIVSSNVVIRDIALKENNSDNNTLIARALNDPTLSSENVSIQIINASDISGIGQRLGRVLTNMGANVVEVSTSHDIQAKSQISYFGDKSYTLDEIKAMTGYPVNVLTRQAIANIVIILGEDSGKTTRF